MRRESGRSRPTWLRRTDPKNAERGFSDSPTKVRFSKEVAVREQPEAAEAGLLPGKYHASLRSNSISTTHPSKLALLFTRVEAVGRARFIPPPRPRWCFQPG